MQAQVQPLQSVSRQRGAAALVMTILLLFASSLVFFYLNRGLIFEQKTSANLMRSTAAFEMAEAGIEWATGMFNSDRPIASDCTFANTGLETFRGRYIRPVGQSVPAIVTSAYPGCKLHGTQLNCSCPVAASAGQEAVPILGMAVHPGFSVTFAAVPGSDTSVRVTATGCTALSGICKPATVTASAFDDATTNPATTDGADAWAQVSVILQLRPLLRAMPSASLACGTSCAIGGTYNIINTDVTSGGQLVNAGTAIVSGPGVNYLTVPGQPTQAALLASDETLSALASRAATCSAAAMFKSYFGTSMADYAAQAPMVVTIPNCTDPSTCGHLIQAQLQSGWKNFFFPDGLSLNSSAPFAALGGAGTGHGVNIVAAGDIRIVGDLKIFGLVFANNAMFNESGAGTADVEGAVIACRTYTNNGSGTLRFNLEALGGVGWRPGPLVRVPGSWLDSAP